LNQRPSGYEPDELPGCSIPRQICPEPPATDLSVRQRSFVVLGMTTSSIGRGFAFGRPGSDLLSRALRHSTIGAEGFHVRVRDGIGCSPLARATRSSKRDAKSESPVSGKYKAGCGRRPLHGTNESEADRAISTAKLNASLHLHMRPILVVVDHDAQRDLVLRRVSRLDAFSVYPFTT
jgi:hypothetical protein